MRVGDGHGDGPELGVAEGLIVGLSDGGIEGAVGVSEGKRATMTTINKGCKFFASSIPRG